MGDIHRSTCFGDYDASSAECRGCICAEHCLSIQEVLKLDDRYMQEMEEWFAGKEVSADEIFGYEPCA